jgi:hypothetical protein
MVFAGSTGIGRTAVSLLRGVATIAVVSFLGLLQWHADNLWPFDVDGLESVPEFVAAILWVSAVALWFGAYAAGGAMFNRQWYAAPLVMTVLPLVMAGEWTDRGDEDGLWVLIYPAIVFVALFFGEPLAFVGNWLRRKYGRRRTAGD